MNRSQIVTGLFEKQLQYNFVFINKFFFTPLCVCRTGTWKAVYSEIIVRFVKDRAFFLPEVVSGFSCADNVVDLAFSEDFCEVVWNCVFNA